MIWFTSALLILILAGPGLAAADVSYPITVEDGYAPALAERTKTINLLRARAVKGGAPPQQVLQILVDDRLDQLDEQLSATEETKPFGQRSPRARARFCAKHQLDPCPTK